MRKLGITPDDSTGKRSSSNSVHRQLERLIHAKIRFEQFNEGDTGKSRAWLDMPVAKAGWLWWDAQDEEQKALWNSYITPHSLYKKSQSLISEGPELWGDSILSPWRTVAMLSAKQLQLGRGGCHESATGATGPGDPWAKRLGDDHRAG
jgi:hypothetical protein